VSFLIGLIILVLHAALIVMAVPAVSCVLGVLRARLAGRIGPALLQPVRDWQRLLRKQPVLPESASPVLLAAPLVSVTALAAAALLVPSFALGMATAPVADLIVLAGLLAASRVATALGALDSGTALGGVAAARAMSLAALTEPVLLLAVFVVASMAGSANLDAVAGALREGGSGLRVSLGLALVAVAIVALVEAGRFQARGSTLGLGMDTSYLSLSGWHLAVAEYAAGLRLVVWLSLLLAMFVPAGIAPAGAGLLAWIAGLLAWVVKMAVLTAGLALIEAGRPALRWTWAPELLGMALLLGLLAAVFLFVSQGLA
jgi:formate hydrogenlyase subunit 4